MIALLLDLGGAIIALLDTVCSLSSALDPSRGTVWGHEPIGVRGAGSVVLLQKTASIERVDMCFGRSHAYFTSVGNNGVTREGTLTVVCASFQVKIDQLLARSNLALA